MLHGEFFVGGNHSKSFATIIAHAETIVANCTTRADALAPRGWSAAETRQLAAAVDALKVADADRERLTDLKECYTAEQTATANDLYRMCRAIQNVARVVCAQSRIAADPTLVGGRAKFMLGEFPPRPGADFDSDAPADSPSGAPLPTSSPDETPLQPAALPNVAPVPIEPTLVPAAMTPGPCHVAAPSNSG